MFKKKRNEQPRHDESPLLETRDNTTKNTSEDISVDLSDLEHFPTMHGESMKTRLEIGVNDVVRSMGSMISYTKSSAIIVMAVPCREILELLVNMAYMRKQCRFFVLSRWSSADIGSTITKAKVLGNVQFRQFRGKSEYWAATRDAEEMVLAPDNQDRDSIIGVHSIDAGFVTLYNQFIGPMFQANSQPL